MSILKKFWKNQDKTQYTSLREMAYERQKFIDNVDNLAPEVLENWFLVYFSVHYGNDIVRLNTNHWRDELSAHMDKMRKYKITSGNKKHQRRSAYEEVFYKLREYNEPENVFDSVELKLIKENIHLNAKEKSEIVLKFIESIPQIIQILVEGKASDILKFANEV